MNNYKVYVHINKANGKRYYGITKQEPKKRWANGKGYKGNEHFYNAINKYGWDNFEHIILFEDLTKEEAKWLEKFYIALYNTTSPKYGYNNSLGGESYNCSEETKKKMSKSRKGKTHSEETKKKMSKASKNTWKNEEHREKMSRANKGENNPMYGKHFTDEHRKKISESMKGKMNGEKHPMYGKCGKDNPSSKIVYIIELDMTFNSIGECAEYLKCAKTSISSVLHGRMKTCKGYHIIYLKDKDNKELIDEIMNENNNLKKQVYIVELDKEFESVKECAEFLGCSSDNISCVLKGRSKTAKGYHIIYLKDKDKLDKKVS